MVLARFASASALRLGIEALHVRTIAYHLIAILAFAMSATCSAASEAEPPILLKIDLRDAPPRLFHTTEIIPVNSGPMTQRPQPRARFCS